MPKNANILMVRHAEKPNSGDDLSVTGHERAHAYAAGDFERALAILQENASDPPSAVLIERCKAFLQVPPPADWHGIYISASK